MYLNNDNGIFDIRFHIEKLTSAKDKNRYQCPVCEGGNLTVNPATGEYQCWNGCECRDIREAIAPWDERKNQNRSLPHPKRQVRAPKPQPAPIPDAPIKLSRFQASAIIHCQDPQNTIYPYSDNQWVERVCQKDRKSCFPYELDSNGNKQNNKLSPQWAAYRESEVIQHGKGSWVLGVEGEKCVEAARSLSMVAFTMQGSDWDKALKSAVARFKQADISGVIYFPDNDQTGRKKAQAVQDACALANLPCIVINPTELNPDAPQKWDIADWVSESNLSPDAMVRIIEATAEGERLAVGGEGMPIVNGEAVYSEDERLRLTLLDLSQEKNKIAYILKRAQICTHYGISKAEVEELIRETERKTSASALKRLSLDDLLGMEIQELTWLIPELLPAGEMVILAGSPKSGKTLMAIDAAFAIATGEDDFLGIRPQRGKVLLISNDENERSTRSKLLKRGFRLGDDNLDVIFNWTIAQMYELEEVLDKFRPDIVIIDSLKSITAHNDKISENSAEFANSIYALKNLLNQYKAASILIHHTSKNKDAMGVAKLRGSSAIAGAVWGTWQLEHIPKSDPNNDKGLIIDPSDPKRIMSVFARDVEGQLLALEFDPESNSYGRTDKEAIQSQNTIADRIMSVLRLNSQGLSGRSIIECLGMSQEEGRGIYTALTRMESKLLVSTIKSPSDRRVTLYILKNTQHLDSTDRKILNNVGDSLPPLPRVQNVEYSAESLTLQGLQNTQQKNQNTQQLTENTQQLFDTNSTDEHLKALPAMDSSELLNKIHARGGGGVPRKCCTNSTECQNELPVATKESGESVTEFAIPSVEPQAEETGAAFKVGDRVKTSDRYDVRFNQIGEVSKVVSDELFRVSWTDGCDRLYETGDLSAI
jgi:KaiC/GvpD/RAD55 family RecA-like ATPase